MRSSNAGAIVILVVAVASALLGLAVIENPGVALPFSIEFIVLLGLTFAGLSREQDVGVRRWLTRLVFATLGLRVLLALVVHFQLTPYFFAPDAIGYEWVGEAISDYWSG